MHLLSLLIPGLGMGAGGSPGLPSPVMHRAASRPGSFTAGRPGQFKSSQRPQTFVPGR